MTPGTVVWLTGLPQSGKSTLANRLAARMDPRPVVLDSDELRTVFERNDFGRSDRDAFYAELGGLATMIANQGHVVIIAATASRRAYRDAVRAAVPHFVEVWVRTSLADCAARDTKGLYAAAQRGQAPGLPGLGEPYEPPLHADVVVDGGLEDRALIEIEQRVRYRAGVAITLR